jgi:hypothetical protein
MNGTGAVGTSTLFARQDHVHPTDTSRAAVSSPTFSGTVSVNPGSAQYPTGISIAPSSHATSRRTALQIDNWQWIQDLNGSGTKDFGLYSNSLGTVAFYLNAANTTVFNYPVLAPTAASGTNNTQVATTAYADASAAAAAVALAIALG